MSEISIQIRRVTERVKKYFNSFGYINTTFMSPSRTIVKAKRRLGTNEIECVISETSRGTSVGFYRVNSLQGLLYAIPFLIPIILLLLNKVEQVRPYISGDKTILSINLVKLIAGNARLSFSFVTIMLFFAFLPFLIEYYIQAVRLSILKSRFTFFTKDAVWETREISPNVISLYTIKSVITHAYAIAILFFGIYSFQDNTIDEITKLYRTNLDKLNLASKDAFSITIGLIIGLIAANKSLLIRKEKSKYDRRNKISGGIFERRIETLIYGVEASILSAVAFGLIMSQTFLVGADIELFTQLILFSIIGGAIGGYLIDEAEIWTASAYSILIFFSSLIFIFRTGKQPEYAFIVVIQLFIIPLPLIIHLSNKFENILKKNGIKNKDWIYDLLPLMAFYTVYSIHRDRKKVIKAYESTVMDEISISTETSKLVLDRDFLKEIGSPAFKLAKHYFELLFSYTASFTEDAFIMVPTTDQLLNWWQDKSKLKAREDYHHIINYADKMLWDLNFKPIEEEIVSIEPLAKEMVIAIK